jgi:hypothetical protein
MVLCAKEAQVGSVDFNHPLAAADTIADMHFRSGTNGEQLSTGE